MKMTGPDPKQWDDGLPQPPEPFFPSGWFRWVIILAVVGSLVGGAAVLFGWVR